MDVVVQEIINLKNYDDKNCKKYRFVTTCHYVR